MQEVHQLLKLIQILTNWDKIEQMLMHRLKLEFSGLISSTSCWNIM